MNEVQITLGLVLVQSHTTPVAHHRTREIYILFILCTPCSLSDSWHFFGTPPPERSPLLAIPVAFLLVARPTRTWIRNNQTTEINKHCPIGIVMGIPGPHCIYRLSRVGGIWSPFSGTWQQSLWPKEMKVNGIDMQVFICPFHFRIPTVFLSRRD